jgi:hypothetical protein
MDNFKDLLQATEKALINELQIQIKKDPRLKPGDHNYIGIIKIIICY